MSPIQNFLKENQYYEPWIPYTVSVVFSLDQSNKYNTSFDFENHHAIYGQWELSEPSLEYSNGTITLNRFFFDLGYVKTMVNPPKKS